MENKVPTEGRQLRATRVQIVDWITDTKALFIVSGSPSYEKRVELIKEYLGEYQKENKARAEFYEIERVWIVNESTNRVELH